MKSEPRVLAHLAGNGSSAVVGFAAALVVATGTLALLSQGAVQADPPSRSGSGAWNGEPIEIASRPRSLPRLKTTVSPVSTEGTAGPTSGTMCPQQLSSHTDASFTGGQYIVQAGFEQGEVAAASYTVAPEDFPLRIDVMEMIFATSNAIVQTTTQWSILIWEGTPATGSLVGEFSSDDIVLPHLVIPPGTNGVNIQVAVDPGDPEQIILNDNGSHTFSIGYRIDSHNVPGSPCISPPPSNQNAFPTTDTSGLSQATQNWIFAVDGTLCLCGSGWFSFQQFPGLCTPSGDWVMRVSWTPFFCDLPTGGCCLSTGACVILTEGECGVLSGDYQGDGSDCLEECPGPSQACCFELAGCLDLDAGTCIAAGGFPAGPGTACDITICFPEGACCLPDGSCLDGQSPEDCEANGGTFQGDGTDCLTTDCPDPLGACCFATGFCLELSEFDCNQAAATWFGLDTTCDDVDGNGTADLCEASCPCDYNGDVVVNVDDLLFLLGNWGTAEADCTDDGTTDVNDLLQVLGDWGAC